MNRCQCTIQYRTSPYIAIRTEYEYEYGYEYEYRTTNDTVVYILNLHTNQPHTNLHTYGHYIHFYIQIALCQNYARLCSIMLVMPVLCQLCFMLWPCYYANSYAGIIRSAQPLVRAQPACSYFLSHWVSFSQLGGSGQGTDDLHALARASRARGLSIAYIYNVASRGV